MADNMDVMDEAAVAAQTVVNRRKQDPKGRDNEVNITVDDFNYTGAFLQ